MIDVPYLDAGRFILTGVKWPFLVKITILLLSLSGYFYCS
jgi:hypothetical protein